MVLFLKEMKVKTFKDRAKEVSILIHMTQRLHSSKQVLPKGANDPTKDNEKEIRIERLTNMNEL
jgi:hypothetical protein